VPASWGDTSMRCTVPYWGRPSGVISFQLEPSFCESQMRPSSVPAQSVSAACGLTCRENTVLKTSTPVLSFVIGSPAKSWCAGVSVVRSSEIRVQDIPWSVDRQMRCEAWYTTSGSWGDTSIGAFH